MNAPQNETVVILHGIGNSKFNMWMVEKGFKDAGYKTLNLNYPSIRNNIEALAQWLHNKLTAKNVWNTAEKVHFVAHSMGGLVTGAYLQAFQENYQKDKLGRVVMLGTPHGGSEVADGLQDIWLYKFVFGPAGQELTTDHRNPLKIKPHYDLGIIAGTQNWLYPLGQYFIDEPHDGCVSVESTKLDGMRDHIVMNILHGVMGLSPKVTEQAKHFIQNGVFNHED